MRRKHSRTVHSYDIHLTPNLPDFTFAGECKITLKVAASIPEGLENSLLLHAKELCFANAHYETEDGQTVVKANEIAMNLSATTVKFTFAESFIPGSTIVLSIQYNGFLNNQMAGFYRSSYVDIDGNSKIMASTQFESLDARRCFPCIDEPAVKAVFGVTLTVDAHLDVLSNMPSCKSERLLSNADQKKKKKRVVFQDTPIMSTYLLAMCVGEFDSVQSITDHGVSVTVYTPPGKSSSGLFALEAATKALDLYDDFFQVKFPLPKLDMIAVPEFAAGAMEVRMEENESKRTLYLVFSEKLTPLQNTELGPRHLSRSRLVD
jgi:aminopeptidase N